MKRKLSYQQGGEKPSVDLLVNVAGSVTIGAPANHAVSDPRVGTGSLESRTPRAGDTGYASLRGPGRRSQDEGAEFWLAMVAGARQIRGALGWRRRGWARVNPRSILVVAGSS